MPVNLVTVTNVPRDTQTNPNAQFLNGSGKAAGNWFGTPAGSLAISNINRFARFVFDTTTENLNNASTGVRRFYHLYGQYAFLNGTHQIHKGVDLRSLRSNARVLSAHQGFIARRTDLGAVIIRNTDANVSHVYAHMSNLTANNSVGLFTVLGNQSNVGLGQNGVAHLHYEVRSGTSTTDLGSPLNHNFTGNVNPYAHMVRVIGHIGFSI